MVKKVGILEVSRILKQLQKVYTLSLCGLVVSRHLTAYLTMSHLHDNLIENLLTEIGLKLILHSISRKRTCPVCTAENISQETLNILVPIPVSCS